MATKSKKINTTFETITARFIAKLAHKEHKTVAGMVRELTLEALDRREDRYLSKIAEKLDHKGVKIYPHDEAWCS